MLRRSLAVAWVVVMVGCGSTDDPGDPGQGSVTVTNLSSGSSLSATTIAGVSSATFQDGFTRILIGEEAGAGAGFDISFNGTPPAVGSYAASTVFPPVANDTYLTLWESLSANEFWEATGGTLQVTSITGGTIALTLTDLTMAPTPTFGGTGTFTINGSVTALLPE